MVVEKIQIEETKEYYPLCPHCESKLDKMNWHKVKGVALTQVGYVSVYTCPRCHKIVGTTASRS